MPQKQAQDFGKIDENQLFIIDNKQLAGDAASTNVSLREGNQIVLNIADAKTGKLLKRTEARFVQLTGNPAVDFFQNINNFLIAHSKVTVREKATFFRLLSVMINAGLPLIKSLRTLGLQGKPNSKLSKTLFIMADEIETGKSLSTAMELFPEVFNEAQIGMIRAGEASGQLNKTLHDLADEVEKSASISGKVRGALIYPVAILVLLTVVIFVMMIAVIPQLSKLFTDTGNELPLPTQILINLSAFTVESWPIMIGGLLTLVVLVSLWKKTKSGKFGWDFLMLKLPIFGKVIQKAALAKFSRAFGNMLASGVPIIKSLEIVANAVGNEVYKQRLFLTAEDMRRGIPMAENLKDTHLFPRMLVNMIEVGEQTAQLESVTLKVAEFYDEEVDTVVKALTKIMEPLILVIIGITVGGLVAAIMLPIIQLTNITGGI